MGTRSLGGLKIVAACSGFVINFEDNESKHSLFKYVARQKPVANAPVVSETNLCTSFKEKKIGVVINARKFVKI